MELGGGQMFAAATQEQANRIIALLESRDMNDFVQNPQQLAAEPAPDMNPLHPPTYLRST